MSGPSLNVRLRLPETARRPSGNTVIASTQGCVLNVWSTVPDVRSHSERAIVTAREARWPWAITSPRLPTVCP